MMKLSSSVFAFLLFMPYTCALTVSPNNLRLRTSNTKKFAGTTSLSMSSALIVQNKGGGHGELGFQLAKNLSTNPKITSITILQDDACNDAKEPFASYGTDLSSDVKVIKAPIGDDMTVESIQSALGGSNVRFDYVWDNASKKPEGTGKALIDAAKTWQPKLYTYVSSAGMYNPDDKTTFPMSEDTTPIKSTAGQALFDSYAVDAGLPFVSFRPQYIYGEKANKYDYIDWYFDRIVRNLPIPIPGDGTQKVSLTNSVDVASILASVLNDEDAAVKQRFFNCGTDNIYSYDEVANMCSTVSGKTANIVRYDDDTYGKLKFPFRLTNFYVAPDKVKSKLGWTGAASTLENDLKWYYDGYKARGGETKDFVVSDDEVTATTA